MIALGVVVAIAISFVLIAISSNNPTADLQQRLSARVGGLLTLADSGAKDASADDLVKVISDTRSIVASDQVTLTSALATDNFKEISPTIVADEADTATTTSLTQAKINGTFDTAYKSALQSKLESTSTLSKELYNKTGNSAVKSAANALYGHLAVLQAELKQVKLN